MLGRPIGVANPEEAEGTATRLTVGACVLGGGTTAEVGATGRSGGLARRRAAVGGGGAKVGRADASVLAARSAVAGLVATGGGGVIRGIFGAGGAATGRGGATGRSAVAAEGLLTRGGGATGVGGGGIRADEGALTVLRWVVGVGARTVRG
ncbi:MAG: hypothetical protein VYB59_04315 [Pseudomonadota bacterium]|nr:hypothetical protein [Pseudomonadota bacterium]